MGAREYDILVLGGTGYLGCRLLSCLCLQLGEKKLRLAAAARSRERLRAALAGLLPGARCPVELQPDWDATDSAATERLVARAHVVINCCSGFAEHAEQMVGACVRQRCHYLDASLGCHAESSDKLAAELGRKYGAEAAAAGIALLFSCSFDFVLSDFATRQLLRKMEAAGGLPHTVESFLQLRAAGGYVIRCSTFFLHTQHAQHVQQRLTRPQQDAGVGRGSGPAAGGAPPGGDFLAPAPAALGAPLAYSRELGQWTVRGAASEAPVVAASQAFYLRQGQQRHAAHYAARLPLASPLFAFLYCVERSVVWVAGALLRRGLALPGAGLLLPLLARLLLLLGAITDDPRVFEESERAKSFTKTWVARGWSSVERLEAGAAPDVCHSLQLEGPSPGYVVTPAALALAATALLQEGKAVPREALGCTTPAAALGGTSFWRSLLDVCAIREAEADGSVA